MIIKKGVYEIDSILPDDEISNTNSAINIPHSDLYELMKERFVTRKEFETMITSILLQQSHKGNKSISVFSIPLAILTITFVSSIALSVYFTYISSQIGLAFLFPTFISFITLLFLLYKYKTSMV